MLYSRSGVNYNRYNVSSIHLTVKCWRRHFSAYLYAGGLVEQYGQLLWIYIVCFAVQVIHVSISMVPMQVNWKNKTSTQNNLHKTRIMTQHRRCILFSFRFHLRIGAHVTRSWQIERDYTQNVRTTDTMNN